jgi:lysophospholipid acyltransferase (LPLAT)-like uncharacterized protein
MIESFFIYIKTILGSILLKFIYGSNRKDVKGREKYESLLQAGNSVILSVWHGQLLSIVHDLRKEKFYAIAGTHEDAEIISRIATKWGWRMIRGSSKEKGDVAYKNMINTLKQPGSAVFITPDGPAGPARIPKPGGIRAAQATNAAIIPISVYSTRRWGFTNWDTFYLEKPFGKIYIRYGTPIFFNKNQDFNECSQILIEKMKEIENICL